MKTIDEDDTIEDAKTKYYNLQKDFNNLRSSVRRLHLNEMDLEDEEKFSGMFLKLSHLYTVISITSLCYGDLRMMFIMFLGSMLVWTISVISKLNTNNRRKEKIDDVLSCEEKLNYY